MAVQISHLSEEQQHALRHLAASLSQWMSATADLAVSGASATPEMAVREMTEHDNAVNALAALITAPSLRRSARETQAAAVHEPPGPCSSCGWPVYSIVDPESPHGARHWFDADTDGGHSCHERQNLAEMLMRLRATEVDNGARQVVVPIGDLKLMQQEIDRLTEILGVPLLQPVMEPE